MGTVHTLAIATPFAIGRVNCYLIDDDPLTLVDTGPNSGSALTELEAELARHGRRVEDLERIVLTHQHLDHVGLAQILADRSGAEVCALDRVASWLADWDASCEADDAFAEVVMLRHGIPEDIVMALRGLTRMFRGWGAAVRITHPLADGDVLEFASRRWTVLHRPGHSPSDTVFHDAATDELLAGDHLLKKISSNALITRPLEGGDPLDPPKSLMIYGASLRATREMDLRLVYGGHGGLINDHRALIDERLRGQERRMRRIARLIGEDGGTPKTAFEIAQGIWGNVAVTEAYLTISEVLGHLDLLIDRGDVVIGEADGVVRFVPA